MSWGREANRHVWDTIVCGANEWSRYMRTETKGYDVRTVAIERYGKSAPPSW